MRWKTSGRFTPAAATRIRISPSRGDGLGIRTGLLDLALREDLDLFSLDDLADRIGFLEAEITRCRAQIARKAAGREAADALFRKPED
jgi:uncharacterized small protein (DUF1192 family)